MSHHPIPQGNYLTAIRNRDLIYTSGMTPRKAGKLLYDDKIKASDPITFHKDAIELATNNALIAAQSCLQKDETISTIIQLNVYLNTANDFKEHSIIADYASDFLIEKLGNCLGSRIAVGVASLPSNARAEISLIAKVG